MSRKGRYGTGNAGADWEAGDFPPRSVPRKVKGGIALASRRGEIGRSWWSKRWIEVLESFGWASRLQRGRSYARGGQVIDLRVTGAAATAKVQGSRPQPYRVTIRLRPTPGPAWDRIAGGIAEDASLVAKLLGGEVPEAMEKVFQASGASFLPKSAAEVEADCSCPDTANPCKHIAAVHYLLAERFDQDPFLLFRLRGRTREDVIGALQRPTPAPGAQPNPSPGAPAGIAVPPLAQASSTPASVTTAEDLLSYWRPGARFASVACTPHPPVVALAVLRRIGEPTFCSPAQARVLLQAFTRVYQKVSTIAIARSQAGIDSRGSTPAGSVEGPVPPGGRRDVD